ncbi:MAG: hypothetical protein IT508_06200, partial [Burkholderiaceae bacterium]|nr:hypothetical protein [Burkholderiaceae bacterium]
MRTTVLLAPQWIAPVCAGARDHAGAPRDPPETAPADTSSGVLTGHAVVIEGECIVALLPLPEAQRRYPQAGIVPLPDQLLV